MPGLLSEAQCKTCVAGKYSSEIGADEESDCLGCMQESRCIGYSLVMVRMWTEQISLCYASDT